MDSLENHGIVIRELRKIRGLSVQQTAKIIDKSVGWLSSVENNRGRCRLLPSEFERVIALLDGTSHRHMFRTWVANYKNSERFDNTFDGAVLKFIRVKKDLSLEQAGRLAALSSGYLSKLENGSMPISLAMRKRIMTAYGYNPSSFKNLATDPIRSKAVPVEFKFKILKRLLDSKMMDQIYSTALSTNK